MFARPHTLFVLFGLVLLAGCSSSTTWGWYVIDPSTAQGQSNIRFLVGGFWATILLSLIAAALSMMIGLLVALPGEQAFDLIEALRRVPTPAAAVIGEVTDVAEEGRIVVG